MGKYCDPDDIDIQLKKIKCDPQIPTSISPQNFMAQVHCAALALCTVLVAMSDDVIRMSLMHLQFQ